MFNLFNFKKAKQTQNKILSNEIITRNNYLDTLSWINYLPDPDPILKKHGKNISVYKDLINDDHLHACITRRKMGVKSMEWRIVKTYKSSDKEIDLINLAINNLSENNCRIKDIISSALNPIFFGFSVFEIIWEYKNGYILPKQIIEKPQEYFSFDINNQLIFNNNLNPINLSSLKYKYKFILLQNEASFNNPYGEKALSKCFWNITLKKGGLKFWSIFVEKYGMPFILAKQPRSVSESDSINLLNKLDDMVQDAIAVIPDDSSVEFKDAKNGYSGDIYEKFINAQNNAISKAILTNVFSTEYQTKGGYSTAQAGFESERMLAQDDKDFPEQLFNTLFKYIILLNTGHSNSPIFKLYEEDQSKKDFAERDSLLGKYIKFNKQYFHRVYNIPLEEFEIGG
jgi:phage gp29-like protein